MLQLDTIVGNWIREISDKNVLPDRCVAILVGLFEGESTYQAYLVGSDEYDPDDDNWACNQDFKPEPRYLDMGVPTSVSWEEVLESAMSAVRSVLSGKTVTLLHQCPHVSVGFDDGDLQHVK